jgi:hypothetical protein
VSSLKRRPREYRSIEKAEIILERMLDGKIRHHRMFDAPAIIDETVENSKYHQPQLVDVSYPA